MADKRRVTVGAEHILTKHVVPTAESESIDTSNSAEISHKQHILSIAREMFGIQMQDYETEIELDPSITRSYIDKSIQRNATQKAVVRHYNVQDPDYQLLEAYSLAKTTSRQLAHELQEFFESQPYDEPAGIDLLLKWIKDPGYITSDIESNDEQLHFAYFPGTLILLDQYYVPFLKIDKRRYSTGLVRLSDLTLNGSNEYIVSYAHDQN